MLKNKEDDFLGDSITRNVKYADNEWQASGTIDRGSVYTKESLLHLFFEGLNYDRTLGDYKDYVPRGSTSALNDTEYVAAKLQHDLYVIDALYYSTNATSSSSNIFNLSTFLRKGISIANPVYESSAKVEVIPIIDVNNEDVMNLTLMDFFRYLIPEGYTIGDLTKSNTSDDGIVYNPVDRFKNLVDRYINNIDTDEVISSYENMTLIDILDTKLGDFLNNLKKNKIPSINKTAYDIFMDDFSLRIHDPDTAKLPFNVRENLEETQDDRMYLSRFIGNVVTGRLLEDGSTDINYVEQMNPLLEEALFAQVDEPFYSGRTVKSNWTTNKSLAKEVLTEGKYKSVYEGSRAEKTLLAQYTTSIDNIDTYISLYCPPVYTGYDGANNPNQSWGIHFLNEESTENLFQDTDNSYSIYNNVVIGYKLVDALIALRTFVGGTTFLIGTDLTGVIKNAIKLDVPLRLRTRHASLDQFMEPGDYYGSVTIINTLYKVGHGIIKGGDTLELPEWENTHSYDFADEVKRWLESEVVIFKGQVYGDYVEEINFLQNLTPDSNVHFNNLRLKKTEIPYNRYQDSVYEVPYIEQTNPLINNTPKNNEGIGVTGIDVLGGIGTLIGNEVDETGAKTRNITPPFIYDWDKGSQDQFISDSIDSRQRGLEGTVKQRVNAKQGTLIVDDRIMSPTIDELWTFLKYLTESDGRGVDEGINERLPKFYGIKRNLVAGTIDPKLSEYLKKKVAANVVNPRFKEKQESLIDILSWEPTALAENRIHWDSKDPTKPELQFGGYTITRYIEKVYDYEVHPFSRRKDILDNDVYEFNTEVSRNLNNVTGYLEKLYNSAILEFNLHQVNPGETQGTTGIVDMDILNAHVLEQSTDLTYNNIKEDNTDVPIFTKENDEKLITTNSPVHATEQRKKAFDAKAMILNYHKADGKTDEVSYHNHYKKYLDHPKNLKEIERDLETIRQNLQTLTEFMTISYPNLGYADRATNRGTLHQLHKNAYEFVSTWLDNANNTQRDLTENESYDTNITLSILTDTLNSIVEDLTVIVLDKKVVFEDGNFDERYLRENYDHHVIDLNSTTDVHTKGKHPMYRPNETLLSEVYLAADGTWRSIHEHTTLPVIYDEH